MNDHKPNRCCSGACSHFGITHAVTEDMGNRKYMEDRHRIEYNLGYLNVYYAIHDGHVGSHAADFISQLCHYEINHRLSKLDRCATTNQIADAVALSFASMALVHKYISNFRS